MTDAVCRHHSICDSFFADGGGEESVDIVVNSRHIPDGKIKSPKIFRDVWLDDGCCVRIKSRLSARLDLDGASDVLVAIGGECRIPEQWLF
jgi:hypothetical protein